MNGDTHMDDVEFTTIPEDWRISPAVKGQAIRAVEAHVEKTRESMCDNVAWSPTTGLCWAFKVNSQTPEAYTSYPISGDMFSLSSVRATSQRPLLQVQRPQYQ